MARRVCENDQMLIAIHHLLPLHWQLMHDLYQNDVKFKSLPLSRSSFVKKNVIYIGL